MNRRALPLFALPLLAGVLLATMGTTCGVPPATSLPPPKVEKAETLGPGDVVEVRIFNEPDLSGTVQISDNGTIRLPLVGVVEAAGQTPDELTVRISSAYNEHYLKNA